MRVEDYAQSFFNLLRFFEPEHQLEVQQFNAT